mmetsp:Transcript_22476/g.56206  ORF Transcript_22476/g.56206 Transcript_22476/m.56206 type:complete len:222 (+) Transcript_22476:486-1151(+)
MERRCLESRRGRCHCRHEASANASSFPRSCSRRPSFLRTRHSPRCSFPHSGIRQIRCLPWCRWSPSSRAAATHPTTLGTKRYRLVQCCPYPLQLAILLGWHLKSLLGRHQVPQRKKTRREAPAAWTSALPIRLEPRGGQGLPCSGAKPSESCESRRRPHRCTPLGVSCGKAQDSSHPRPRQQRRCAPPPSTSCASTRDSSHTASKSPRRPSLCSPGAAAIA